MSRARAAMTRLTHRGEAGDGDGASMLAAAPAPAGAVANPFLAHDEFWECFCN